MKTKMTADEIVTLIEKKLHAKWAFGSCYPEQISILEQLIEEIATEEELEKEIDLYNKKFNK